MSELLTVVEYILNSDYLLAVVYLLFFISLIRNSTNWLSLWAEKGYQVNRIIIYISETDEGRQILFGWTQLLRIAAIILYVLSIFQESILLIFPLVVGMIYGISTFQFGWELINNSTKYPRFDLKSIFIFCVLVILALVFISVPLLDEFFWLLLIEKVVTVILLMYFLFWTLLDDFFRDISINKAIKKREQFHQLISIAVVGSYGKRETKEFIHSVISKKWNTLKTESLKNSPEQISERIITKLTMKKQILISDLTSYHPGTMKELSSIVKPTAVIITTIGNEHIAAFRTKSRLLQEFHDVVSSIPRNGYILYNAHDSTAHKLVTTIKRQKYRYAIQRGDRQMKADIIASDLIIKPYLMRFRVRLNQQDLGTFRVHLAGEHVIIHLLPAIFAGINMQVPLADIKKVIADLTPANHIMQPFQTILKVHVIDDTYHVNHESVQSVLSHLENYKRKKAMVFQPIDELGKDSEREHYAIGRNIAKICDYLILTNKNNSHAIRKGFASRRSGDAVSVLTPKEISRFVGQTLKRGDVVAFVGRQSRSSLSMVLKHQGS